MSKRNLWFTADWHCGHFNIIHYCNRPFKTVEEMHEKMIKEYKFHVNEGDIVFFLGDMGFYDFPKFKELITSLPGKKILIKGNHDKWGDQTYYNAGFDAILQDATIKIGKREIYLNHIPRRTFSEFIRLGWVYLKDNKRNNWNLRNKINRLKKEWKRYKSPSKNWTFNGHVHQAWQIKGKNINVGVDVWEFKPVHFRHLISIMDKELQSSKKSSLFNKLIGILKLKRTPEIKL